MILYLFVVVPIMFGLLWNKIENGKKPVTEDIFTNGYFLMLAVFMLMAFPAVNKGMALRYLAKLWLIIAIVISIMACALCWRDGVAYLKQVKGFLQNSTKMTKMVLIFFLILSVISVLFIKPHVKDDTIPVVNSAIATDVMYGFHPYTGEAYKELPVINASAPIEMLYGVAGSMTGVPVVMYVQFLLPIIFQIWFFLNYWRIGRLLFGEKEEHIAVFSGIVLLLHLTPLYVQGQGMAAGIFRNAWNGQTLLACCVLPGVFYQGIRLIKRCNNCLKWTCKEILGWIGVFCIMFLAAQLVYVNGIYYASVMSVFFATIVLVRKGIGLYGTKIKNH